MKVTPSFLVSFETRISGLITTNWDRVIANLSWDRLMKTRPSSTKVELLTWLLETAKIYDEGNGGQTRFDDMVAATHQYENFNAGVGLRLTKNEIEDNQLKDNPTVGALDYAGTWAKQVGAASAYWPQQKLVDLITNGKTLGSYDGVPFFSASHPVNPATPSSAVYSNIISAKPINAAPTTTEVDALVTAQKNFASALASVRSQKFINGVPRYLMPSVVVGPTALAYRLAQLTGGDLLSQSTNVLPNEYSFSAPLILPELDAEPDVYYIGCTDMMADELGAFVFSEREPFSLRTYSPMDEAALNRLDQFEWTLKGRNTALYGHPYLFFRVEPT